MTQGATMNYKKTKLGNSLRIITVPMKETQTATVVIMVGVGSRYEKNKEAGLSHFIEHMMFKGTKKRPTALSISEELDAVGGEYNAYTSKDSTGYYVKVDAKHLELALDVVSDMYLNSKIEQVEIEKEKGTIIQELNMYEDTPVTNAWSIFEELLYKKNSLGRDAIGNKKTIQNFQRKDFVDYIKKFYTANDTVICVAGKFDEKKIKSQVQKYFSKMLKGKKVKIEKIKGKQVKSELKIKFKKTDQTHLILGVKAYDENHKDRFALSLLSVILGGNMSSRLFIEVRERRGLAYYIRTGVETFADCGYLASNAGVEHKNLEKAIQVILEEYKKISKNAVSEKELQKAKDFIKGKSLMGLEASDEVAMFFISQELRKKKIMKIEEIFAKIDKVTPRDILRVAEDIFQNSKLNLAVIGPHRDSEKLERLLKL
jgi:predicted Zn-dependent peptidase